MTSPLPLLLLSSCGHWWSSTMSFFESCEICSNLASVFFSLSVFSNSRLLDVLFVLWWLWNARTDVPACSWSWKDCRPPLNVSEFTWCIQSRSIRETVTLTMCIVQQAVDSEWGICTVVILPWQPNYPESDYAPRLWKVYVFCFVFFNLLVLRIKKTNNLMASPEMVPGWRSMTCSASGSSAMHFLMDG